MKKYTGLIFFLVGVGAIPAICQKAPTNQAELEAFMILTAATGIKTSPVIRHSS